MTSALTPCRSILIVDDEASVLSSLRRLLRHHNRDFQIQTVENGQAGLNWLKSNEAALILSDQRMPQMSGYEFLAQARQLQPDAIRVMLTGYSELESVVAAINEGHIYQYITKPWDDFQLALVVDQCLERYNLQKENRISRERLLDLMKHVNWGVVTFASDGTVAYVNDTFLEFLGRDRAEVQALVYESLLPDTVRHELEAQHKSTWTFVPNLKAVEHSFSVQRLGSSLDGGPMLLLRDRTDDEIFASAVEKLISNVTHELNTPLTSIEGYARLMKDKKTLTDAERFDFVDVILRQTRRLSGIIHNMLNLAEVSSGEQAVQIVDYDFHKMLQSSVDAAKPRAREKNINVIMAEETQKLAGQVPGDPLRLEQVLSNLITNAIKYSPPNTTITIEGGRGEQDYWFAVKDQGNGIPEVEQHKIFERFYRIENDVHTQEGLGLGLSLCKSFVDGHRGQIQLDSKVGKGSTFKVVIPTHKS